MFRFRQFNFWWLPKLAKFGINQHNIFDPCTNIHVGTWIIAHNIKGKGITETTLGAYNAGFRKETEGARSRYVAKLKAAMHKLSFNHQDD